MNLKELYHFQFLENSLKNNMAIPSIMGSHWGCSWIFCWSMEMGRFISFTPSNSSFDSANVLFLGLGGSWIGEPASFASWSLSRPALQCCVGYLIQSRLQQGAGQLSFAQIPRSGSPILIWPGSALLSSGLCYVWLAYVAIRAMVISGPELVSKALPAPLFLM